jgi:hypothetical protein
MEIAVYHIGSNTLQDKDEAKQVSKICHLAKNKNFRPVPGTIKGI